MCHDVVGAFAQLLSLLDRLESQKIWYRLEHVRDSIMVVTAVPGERWEIEFFDDDHVEIERVISDGHIAGADVLEEYWERCTDA
jgi:hypothetical protein